MSFSGRPRTPVLRDENPLRELLEANLLLDQKLEALIDANTYWLASISSWDEKSFSLTSRSW